MAEEAAASPEEAPKKKLPLLPILLGVQFVVMLVAGGFILKIALNPRKVDLSQKVLQERAIASVRDDLNQVQMIPLEPFIVNLVDRHTLKTQFDLEVSNPQIASLIHSKIAAIRARILNVLTRQSYSQAEKLQGKLLIKDAIRDAIHEEIFTANNSAVQGAVRDIYFLDFTLIYNRGP